MIYELDGTFNGVHYEIEITPDGKIIEIEESEEEDDKKPEEEI